jgi:hypothetical protein
MSHNPYLHQIATARLTRSTRTSRDVSPSGPYGEINEWSLYDESFRRLVAWTIDSSYFYKGLRPLRQGGD